MQKKEGRVFIGNQSGERGRQDKATVRLLICEKVAELSERLEKWAEAIL